MITPEEYKYLSYVLSCATNYTVARGEQITFPTVNHKKLEQKLQVIINRSYK
jgi:hypothetical protein